MSINKEQNIIKRNAELEKELAAKDRELEIQSALERVRTTAMAMNEPADMLQVCRKISDQLLQLGFKQIRNVQTVIIYPQRHEYLNYQYFTPYDKDSIEVIDYRLHPDVLDFTNRMLASADAYYAKTFEGKELNDWREYRKQTNQLPDPKLDATTSSHYYFYSIGSGALGVTTYAPLNEKEISLFKRFRNVFELAYRRFVDIEKAQAQAREAKIEVALERTRTQSMIMQHSKELDDVLRVFHQQVLSLGINSAFSFLWLPDEKNDRHIFWASWGEDKNGSTVFKSKAINYPLDRNEPATAQCLVDWKSNEPVYSYHVPPAGVENYFAAWQELIDGVEQLKPEFFSGGLYYVEAFMKYGCFGVMVATDLTEDEKKLLSRFAIEFERTYTRFLDLQKAEAQTREAQIEAGLERVRSRSLAMHNTSDLQEVIHTVHKELLNLNIAIHGGSFIAINRDVDTVLRCWGSGGTADTSEEVSLPLYEKPFCTNLINRIKNAPGFFTEEYTEKDKKDFFTFLLKHEPWSKLDAKQKRETLSSPGGYTRSCCVSQHTSIFIVNHLGEKFSVADNDILQRFGKVFEQTYTRFLDLQKAEAQAREAQIETALERVRSRTMGMQKSEELKEVIQVVYEQFVYLNIKVEHSGFLIDYKAREDMHIWLADQHLVPSEVTIPYFDSPPNNSIKEAKEKGQDFFTYHLTFEEKNKFYRDLFKFVTGVPEETLEYYFNCPGLAGSGVLLDNIGLYIENFSGISYTDEENNTLMRFGKVFQQTYTRFLDLQKAEAQAREAQIEASLERVRGKAMGMHKSEDLNPAVAVVFEELDKLNLGLIRCGIAILDKEKPKGDVWITIKSDKGNTIQVSGDERLDIHPLLQGVYDAWLKQEDYYYVLENDDLVNYYQAITRTGFQQPITATFAPGEKEQRQYFGDTVFQDGNLFAFLNVPFTDEVKSVMKRFANVFNLTYKRFLDLQKAEAQTKEAQIEAALERVRAKVMAMTSSKDLNETSLVFGEQLRKLNIDWQFSYFWLIDEPKNANTFWITWPDHKTSFTTYTLAEAEEYFNDCLVSWRAGVKIHDNYVPPEGVQAWLDTFQRIADDAGGVAKEIMVFNTFANGVYYYDAMMKYGSFGICVSKPATDEEKNIQCRFAIEFERAYTRFFDLQKAEAQAREAQIEMALEKIRASTMAMQKSDDLSTAAYVLFQQFRELGAQAERIFIATIDDDQRWVDIWGTNQGGNQLNKLFKVPIDEPTMISKIVTAWQEKKRSIVIDLTGDDLHKYVSFLKNVGIPVTEGVMDNRRVQTIACFSKGVIGVTTPEPQPEESIQLLERFAGVFDLTYTRFLDLTVAETKAHEARIEVALERVRARALAMQVPEELTDVAQVLRNEMGLLGVEELETSSIYIHHDNSEKAECWYALKDPNEKEKRMVADHFALDLNDTWVGREMQKFYKSNEKQTSIVMQGANRKEWIGYCYKHSPVFTGFYGETIPDRTYHLYKFSHGYIGAAAPGEISDESWGLLSRAASVFSLAYSRFKDLTQARTDLIKLKEEKKRAEEALTELQATQKQLIQAEKMASLGELTAGIAHEIQNPLNFVNNFSEVSNELLEEMKTELATGNTQLAIEIAKDVKDNLEKILHHGKRADAIVKGMLQHSRSSSGQKELTDINVLAEEYLRLAYHGLRAKDKFFNSKFETDLDPSINKINIIPQEIGRVILNLINNSFYAVSERKKNTGNGYEPAVTVSTKKINDKIEIRVKDNGNGIPQKVLDKIFQPFFTTKPTGEGTGLGLSLSYDIITKGHDGEIKVETKEGEGSEFIISLPVN